MRMVLVLILFYVLVFTNTSDAQVVKRVEEATEVLNEIMAIPEKGIPPALLRDAEGIAIIPRVIKVGFVIGGRHGKGIMVVKNDKGEWSYPFFISFTGGSIGWQIGAQSTDIILVFRTKRSVDGIIRGKFTLGADASIAAGPVGRHAEAGTDIELKAEILSYSRSRGIFAGVSLEGSTLQMDYDSNEEFYRRSGISLTEIINRKTGVLPEPARVFLNTLKKYIK
jgi:lipid-binding SYLF domain-containing protein